MKTSFIFSLLTAALTVSAFATETQSISLPAALRLVQQNFTQDQYRGTTASGSPCSVDITLLDDSGFSVNVDTRNSTGTSGSFDSVSIGDSDVRVLDIEQLDDGNKLSLEAKLQYPGGGDLGPSSKGSVELMISQDLNVTIKNNSDPAISCKLD